MDAVIFDMDGTLADVSGIRHHLRKPKGQKDFDAFHRESIDCPANLEPWTSAVFLGALGVKILIVTARQAKWRYHTILWLHEQHIPYSELYMRTDGDFRPDYEIKRDLLAQIRRDGYNPILAWDDNPAIVQLWTEEGIPCMIVPGWDKDLTETEGKAR